MYENMLARLRAERTEAQKRGAAIIDGAEAAGRRDLNPSEQRDFDGVTDLLGQIDERIEHFEDLEEREALMARARAELGGSANIGGGGSTLDSRQYVDAFRSAVLERNPAPIHVKDPNPQFVRSLRTAERRDLTTSAPANFRPVSFHDRIIVNMIETSAVLRAGATLLTTSTGETLRVPKATADSTAAIVAEAAAIGESDPTLDVVSLGAYKYGVLFQVSHEMVNDTTVDLESYLSQQAGRAIGTALGAHLMTGTGTGQPTGVVTTATVGKTGPTGTATGFGTQATAGQGTDLLNDLYGSLAEPYVADAGASPAFLLRNATLTAIRNLKTSAGEIVGSQYVASPPAPFHVDPNVAAMGANAKSVVFGDWSRYFVRMVNGIRFERSDDFAFDKDLVTFRAVLRADGALVDANAIKVFQHSAT